MTLKAVLISIAMLVAATLVTGAWFIYTTSQSELDINGFNLPDPEPVAAFTLASATDADFNPDDFKGHWTFLYFGYMFCPDACPLTLAQLSKAQQLLAEKGADKDNAYVFISVDPERDTPEKLRDYTAHFNPKFIGVTGTRAEIDKLVDHHGIFYAIDEHEEDDNAYTVYHPSELFLINPDAQLQALLRYPENPVVMADDFLKIRAHYERSPWKSLVSIFGG